MLSSQFTDTIRANFDNFNSKLSIPINIKNYDDINISKVENYYCNGNSLTFQPHIYNYKIAYWRVVKSIEIEISGQSDDYAQVIVNNSITVHPNLQDTLGIKDGIYIWGKTQSSDYVKEKHPFTMTNENLNIQFGTVNTLPTVCYLKASLKIRLFFQFTDTITSKATQLLSNSISTNLAIQNQETFTFKALDPGSNQVVGYSKSYIFTKKLRASFKYAKHIIVKFSGTANDYATINLNLGGNNYNYQSNASYYFAGCYSSVKPDGSFVDFVNYNLDQNINFNNNQVNVKITQHGTCSLWTDISVQGSILVQYKQFTDTVTPTLKSLGSFNNSLKIVLKTVFTTRISNIISDTGRCEGYCYWEYDVVSLNASILSNPENYAKAVAEFSIYGKADDGFKFYLNGTNITTFASVCNHGSCTNKSDWIPSLHSFEYSLTSKTNNLLIKAYSIKNDYWAEIYSAVLTIKTESKQFTDTIKVLCNNASKQILISKPFTAPTSTSERCRQYGYYYGIPIEDFVGSSGAASQTKTFTASDFLYSEHIKKYEVKFACGNGTCVFRINGEIKYNKTMCATCPDRSSGITVSMPVTISSSSSLNSGFAQSAFRVCAFYQFTDTINTVNPDCNVKAETKYQSVNITLPFNLVISPQDRWCEIHLSRVDYITTVSGGFPNTAVRVDFTSSSGHDPNYSNRIMYFDANGNLTFSNFCTQQSHSGSVDTWNITYMGKHYHFTIHWYW